MRIYLPILLIGLILIVGCTDQFDETLSAEEKSVNNAAAATAKVETSYLTTNLNLKYYSQAFFKLKGEKIVYIDPWEQPNLGSFNLDNEDKADLILITHPHGDHCDIASVEKLITSKTVIITVSECGNKLRVLEGKMGGIITVIPGDAFKVRGIGVEVWPMYDAGDNHPKNNNYASFVVEMDEKRIYHSGDSAFMEEQKNITNIDIALLAAGRIGSMGPEEAAKMALAIKPKVAIPMHFSWKGTSADVKVFEKIVSSQNQQIKVLSPEKLS